MICCDVRTVLYRFEAVKHSQFRSTEWSGVAEEIAMRVNEVADDMTITTKEALSLFV